MNRRDFVKYSLLTAGGVAGLGLRANHTLAQVAGGGTRTLIHVMLLGGADLRYLFVPDPKSSPEYAAAFWEARRSIYQYNAANTQLYPTYDAVFSALYRPVTDPASGLPRQTTVGFLGVRS